MHRMSSPILIDESTIIEVNQPTGTTAKPRACTQLEIRRLSRLVSRHFDAHVAPSGLTMTQYSLLSCLRETGGARPVDLTRILDIEASTLSRVIKPMVKSGWIVVKPGPDSRSHLVSLTQAGQGKLEEAYPLWRNAQRELDRVLGEDVLVRLHEGLALTLRKLRTTERTEQN